jgi:hypothetical protein
MKTIPHTDPRWQMAKEIIDKMHDYRDLNPSMGAIQWIQDTNGRVIIFTRGEYRDTIMQAIKDNLQPSEFFEQRELEDDENYTYYH